MMLSIFSEMITVKAGTNFNDGTATIRIENELGEEITFFANVGELYKMAQGIENALDSMDIPSCEECHEYKAGITGDEVSGCQVCQDCRDEQNQDYAEYYTNDATAVDMYGHNLD